VEEELDRVDPVVVVIVAINIKKKTSSVRGDAIACVVRTTFRPSSSHFTVQPHVLIDRQQQDHEEDGQLCLGPAFHK
jgi:hypothetical protein